MGKVTRHYFDHHSLCIMYFYFPAFFLTSTLRSHTTGEFHGSHTGSILPSQFRKRSWENYPSDVDQKIMEHALNTLDFVQKVGL